MKKRKTDVIFNNEKAKVIESDSRKMPRLFWDSFYNPICGWHLPNLPNHND
jgi:hypothetical protein